jgi:transposase
MRKSSTTLNDQAREIIYYVHCFMKNEAENGVSNLKQVQKRTAKATNTCVATVRRIVREGERNGEFKTPGKKRPREKPMTDLDNFDQGVIKRCILNFYSTEQVLPTVEKLRQKLQNDINYQGSEGSLRRIIKKLGFKWQRTENNKLMLVEVSNIRSNRIDYLQMVTQYRQEGRPIVYTDETFIVLSHTTTKIWSDGTAKGIKKPVSKAKRVAIFHAGSDAGLISNALLTAEADVDTGKCHDDMNFEKWLRTRLVPNLPNNSVVVVNVALLNNKQSEPVPVSTNRSEMQAWLTAKDISYTEDMINSQLYSLIRAHVDQSKKFNIYNILAEHNHDILWLPSFQPDLNPIEMAGAAIKGYVTSQNVDWSFKDMTFLVKEKVDLMTASHWSDLCQKVKHIEQEYKKSDLVFDKMTQEFAICTDDEDSESEEDDIMEDDDDDEETGTASCSLVGWKV